MNQRSSKLLRCVHRFRGYYQRLSAVSGLEQLARYPQHGTTSRLLHSIAIAYYSYRLASCIGISIHAEELVRGALLHDYFLYDAQDGNSSHKGHWTRHPEIALKNAAQELELTDIETDIIKKHMFPLTLQPPRCRESVLVSLTDKGCSVYEFFRRKKPYQKLRRDVMGGISPFLLSERSAPPQAGGELPEPLSGVFFFLEFPGFLRYTKLSGKSSGHGLCEKGWVRC